MDVLLLHPSTFRKSYGAYAAAGGRSQPLGICYIAAVLEENSIDAGILDADILNLTFEQTLEDIEKKKPEILMISVLTATFDGSVDLARALKSKNPGIKIIVGGPHLAIDPEDTMKNDCFDVGVIGEAEYTTLELVQCLLKNEDFSRIKGIIYMSNGNLAKTEDRELIKNLDEVPMPAYHLLPHLGLYHPQIHSYKYKPIISMVTSRGCPHRCIFCDQGVFGKTFRYVSGRKIVDQIEEAQKKFGVREVMFYDDVFTLNKSRIYEMCREIEKRKIKIAWSCSARANHVDNDLLKSMKKAGCWMIGIGIESGNQEILDFIKKDLKLERIKESVEWANQEGIKVRGFFQIGHPKETKESIEDTINFATSLNLYAADFLIATPFKGTEFYDIASEHGDVDVSDKSKFSKMFPVFTPYGLTREYLFEKQKELHKRFYLRPSKILEYILMIKSFSDFKRYFAGAKILLS